MTAWYFFVLSLACYRATVLICRDKGPLAIFKKMRAVPKFNQFLKCPFCVSIWVAAIIEAIFYFTCEKDKPIVVACIVFAFSAVTIAIDRVFTSDVHND